MAPGPLRHSWNGQVVHLFNLSNLSSGGTFFLTQRFSKMPWPDSMETRFLIGLSQQRCKIIQNRQTRLSKGQCTTVQTSMMTSSKWNALSCSKSSAVPFIDQCSSCWKQNKLYTTGNPVPSGSVFTQAAGKQTNFSSFGSPTVQRVQGLKHQNHVENGHWFKAAQLLRWSQMISDYLSASQLLHPSPNFSVPLCFSMVKRREFGPSIRSCHSWWKLLREGVPPYPPLVQVAVRKQKRSCNGPICTGQKEICTLVFNLWTLWKPGHKIKSKSRYQVFERHNFVTPPFRCQICHLRRISAESPSNPGPLPRSRDRIGSAVHPKSRTCRRDSGYSKWGWSWRSWPHSWLFNMVSGKTRITGLFYFTLRIQSDFWMWLGDIGCFLVCFLATCVQGVRGQGSPLPCSQVSCQRNDLSAAERSLRFRNV